jgi:hypothetical protein
MLKIIFHIPNKIRLVDNLYCWNTNKKVHYNFAFLPKVIFKKEKKNPFIFKHSNFDKLFSKNVKISKASLENVERVFEIVRRDSLIEKESSFSMSLQFTLDYCRCPSIYTAKRISFQKSRAKKKNVSVNFVHKKRDNFE